MDLRRLRYFVAVAEEGHLTRAAARLGMQQPPLTAQIKLLESEMQAVLFVRTPRGMALTLAGQALLEEAARVFAATGAAVARTRQVARGQAGRLVVGFTTSSVLHPLVPDILRVFRARFPEVRLELIENSAAYLTEAVDEGKAGIAVIRAVVARPGGVLFEEVLREDLLLVLPRGHRLVAEGPRRVALAELAHERFILVRRPGAPGIYQDVVHACRTAGFEPQVEAEVGHMLTNINLVAAGAGVTLVPASMGEVNLRQVVYCRLADQLGLAAPLTLVHRTDARDPVLGNFLSTARERAGVMNGSERPG